MEMANAEAGYLSEQVQEALASTSSAKGKSLHSYLDEAMNLLTRICRPSSCRSGWTIRRRSATAV